MTLTKSSVPRQVSSKEMYILEHLTLIKGLQRKILCNFSRFLWTLSLYIHFLPPLSNTHIDTGVINLSWFTQDCPSFKSKSPTSQGPLLGKPRWLLTLKIIQSGDVDYYSFQGVKC